MRLAERLERLERMAATERPIGSVYRIIGGTDGPSALAAFDVKVAANDLVVHRQFYRPSATGPVLLDRPVKVTGAAIVNA